MIDGNHSPLIKTDKQRLMQIILGLLSNALKFTSSGHVKTSVRIIEDESSWNKEHLIEISIHDTGIGISKQDQSKLFKLFGFIESSGHLNTKGIGLGLHIAQQIVQKFEGQVHVKSVYGEGSTFSFTMKLQTQDINLVDGIDLENYVNRDTLFDVWEHASEESEEEKEIKSDSDSSID